MKKINGFDFTENFDRKININENTYYFNLKFICDKGGSQTRSLREVYHFIYAQLKYLLNNKTTNIYFYNILDGDSCYESKKYFKYLIDKIKFSSIKKFVFIGDTYEFNKYWKNKL
jgi:hypothetical protein